MEGGRGQEVYAGGGREEGGKGDSPWEEPGEIVNKSHYCVLFCHLKNTKRRELIQRHP